MAGFRAACLLCAAAVAASYANVQAAPLGRRVLSPSTAHADANGGVGHRPALAHAARSYVPHVPSVNDIVFSHDGAKPVGRRLQGGNNFGQPNLTSIVSVLDFGAVGDSKFDNTNAFQSAINSLATTGGIVYVPSGLFAFNGSLNFPKGVSLVGTYQIVPSHNVGQGGDRLGDGSALLPRANRGDANATAFITLTIDCTVRGFTIWYPDNPETVAPAPYPYTIDMVGDNIAVTDVELLNSWNGIRAVGAHRHYIARVQGQPVNIGILVDQTYDIGRIEDVHFNPWYSSEPAYVEWQTTQGIAFLIARTDWEYVLNTFVFAMSVGYKFIDSAEGSCNGNFVGIGADCCANASVQVDAADPWGIAIINGEFTSFSGGFGPDIADHTQVVVSPSNTGAVRFVNSAFWGPSNQIAKINGTGSVGFESCMFNTWDANSTGTAAIQVYGGDAMVRGNDFQTSHPGGQVLIGPGARKVIVTDNLMVGALNVPGQNNAKVAIVKDNAPDV